MSSSCLLVCSGKDCRSAKGYGELLALAASLPGSQTVPCQSLCHGPIAGVSIAGDVRWYERVRTAKVRTRLARSVTTQTFVKSLKPNEIRKRRSVIRGAGRMRAIRLA